MDGGAERVFRANGSYIVRNKSTNGVYRQGNLIDELLTIFAHDRTNLKSLDRLSVIKILDEPGNLLWHLEKTPTATLGEYTWVRVIP